MGHGGRRGRVARGTVRRGAAPRRRWLRGGASRAQRPGRQAAYADRAVPEVVGAVDFRRREGLEIAIRGGGHNVAGVSVCDASNRSRAIALSNSDSKPHRRRTNRRVDARWTPRLVLVAPADNERSRSAGTSRSPLPDSNRRPPPYHALVAATGRNRRQGSWLVFAASAPNRFATDGHRLRPRGSIKAPSFVLS